MSERFRALSWPAAVLSIQPPDGETLVNLETIFFTGSGAVTKTVPLLGQRVQIRATPHSYTWHWTTGHDPGTDDDKAPLTTRHAGAAFPDQTITHRYTTANVMVHPRLDITYQGEYRIGAATTWIPIPESRTITGTPQEITVLEARPTLVR